MDDYNYEEKPKRGVENGHRESPCMICNSTHYEWGRAGSEGGLYFLPEGAIFGFGMGEKLSARKCLRCGNVQWFISEW